ncbi:MAG: DUF6881 domain-containing protein [Methyloligellaceae bacterium]
MGSKPSKPGLAESWFFGTWLTASEDEPYQYYDELDNERWTIRCVRKYRDGTLIANSYDDENWRDTMPEGPIPSLKEINSNAEFIARDISKSDFETIWKKAVTAGR